MPEVLPLPIRDLDERARALDVSESFIVRAPAGSGKTDLLTRRFLRLLTVVNEPEEILAITFTRAATAEMRARILGDLERAARTPEIAGEDDRLVLARAALAHAERRGWRLLEQPHRLTIETIDSLCLRIAHGQPLLANLGGRLAPTEQGDRLYAQAARRLLSRLGSANPSLDSALTYLLTMRDNNLADCEGLIAGMLAQRDQWLRVFPIANLGDDEEVWDELRYKLEKPFRDEIRRVLQQAHASLAAQPLLASELFRLGNFALANGCEDLSVLAGISAVPSASTLSVDHWLAICSMLLTKGNEWRSRLTASEGFPPVAKNRAFKEAKDAMLKLLQQFAQVQGFLQVLCAIRSLPRPHYDEQQWQALRHFFTLLRHAVAELRVLFAEQNAVDFPELGIAARHVLQEESRGIDRLLALSGNLHHLLIDEFQDTSRSQHQLVSYLVRAWEQGEGRTCFLVGDPMQSIYMFRQAEVELFYQVESRGIGDLLDDHCIACEPVQLLTNFRSHAGLTSRWNEIFTAVFGVPSEGSGVPFTESFASEPTPAVQSFYVHPQIIGTRENRPTAEERQQAQRNEAEAVVTTIEHHLPAIRQAELEGREYRVAVLVRARQHLAEILPLLRRRNIPFRAVELETLAERQEMLDLLALTRALLHPMDRIVWLSVLRAPWCGLTLADLHTLAGRDDRSQRNLPMLELLEQHLPELAQQPQARAQRVLAILRSALGSRFTGAYAASFSQWIERTWRSLGGPRCLDAAGLENAQVYFTLLDGIAPDGIPLFTPEFDDQLKRLFATPDPTVSERAGVQLMTIHKSKGLGFDVVLVPGLERKPTGDRGSLIVSLQRTAPSSEEEVLLAPIGSRGDDRHATYAWIQRQRDQRAAEERKRLLYVACTRARRELHLFGTATVTKDSLQPGDARSLLASAWPALEEEFAALVAPPSDETNSLLPFPEEPIEIAAEVEQQAASLSLRRLRDLPPIHALQNVTATGTIAEPTEPAFVRPEGSRRARLVGSTVHTLLEDLSQGISPDTIRTRAQRLLREAALSGRALESALEEVVAAVHASRSDPDGAWLLGQRENAESETSWTSWNDATSAEPALQTLRADRVFVAGETPRAVGSHITWIVDYKMSAPAGEALEAFLAHQRELYAPQLAAYAEILKRVEGRKLEIRFGLYFPRIARLEWWKPAAE
ncbi:UvrD-helicase domain-containing protein [Silvibacterium sp.]|uniref:UvrD-helicase domain-containing protein n=1 Tax=Silvibacterium sp. TaxID=1964179 RepID=UPI0039E4C892